MGLVYFLRHPPLATKGFIGWSNPIADEVAEPMLQKLLAQLNRRRVSQIVSSPLRRCQAVAKSMTQRSRLPLQIEPNLRELHFGDWEGLTWDEIRDRYPKDSQTYCRQWPFVTFPGGENLKQFIDRVKSAISQHSQPGTIFVCHKGVIQAARHLLTRESIKEALMYPVEYNSLSCFCTERCKILFWNQTL